MRIGKLHIDNPFILAPLAGYTDLAFRLLCREYGAGLTCSEMISCHGLVYRQRNTLEMIRTIAAERPVAMQLFGSEPEIMGEAAAILTERDIDCIDINMGCPVKKVTKKGAGAALMKTPELAAKIIKAVGERATVPVSVKIRSGWSHQSIIAPEFARMAQDAGASAIAVHGRTWSDGFGGRVDWNIIAKVKEAVTIPVIGNGDLISRRDGLAMMEQTGCDAVMIGRAALGAPWVFANDAPADPPLPYRLKALNRHLSLIKQHLPSGGRLAKIKNQAGKYFKGLPGGSAIRTAIYQSRSLAELEDFLARLAQQSPGISP